jgi:hypothetical protein
MTTTSFKELAKTGGNPEFFRARGTYLYSTIGYIFCAGMIASILIDANGLSIEQTPSIAFMLFFVSMIYRFLHRPVILFTDVGVGVKNPFATIVVDWADITNSYTKFVLTFETNGGLISCWSAVGPSRYQHRAIHREDLGRDAKATMSIRATDSPHTDSGAAFSIAKHRISNRTNLPVVPIVQNWTTSHISMGIHLCSLLAILLGFWHF